MTPSSCLKTLLKGPHLSNNLVPKPSRTKKPLCRVHVASMDDNDSGDESLRREFAMIRKKADPQAALRAVEHLNLLWSVSERKKPEMCGCCHGTGQKECSWCHGTGAMTLGDTLFCSEQGCRPCPVCAGSGSCNCDHCRGTGKRAAWMSPGCPVP